MVATQILKKLSSATTNTAITVIHRTMTTSAEYVASRVRDPTFERLMENYKNYLKAISIQDLILASRSDPPSVSVEFLQRLSQKLYLNFGARVFLRKYPHYFHIFDHPEKHQPFCMLTPEVNQIISQESDAINDSLPLVKMRLIKLLSMSQTKTVPLRAVFKVWRELGLPDDFEDSVISRNSDVFELGDGNEPNTHTLILKSCEGFEDCLVPAVENWRVVESCKEDANVNLTEMKYRFKQGFPPQMRVNKTFKAKVREWQKLPYVGPYEERRVMRRSKHVIRSMEKRAVGIMHEFLSLTVEKMVEVEKVSHFRQWFGIDLNVRDLFLDHPGIFYLSTKGKRHTVFLREAYMRGCLIEPNPVYEARRKLLYLVAMGRRGMDRRDNKEEDEDWGEASEAGETSNDLR